MERHDSNHPPRYWVRRHLVATGLFLLVAGMGFVGGMVVFNMLTTSIDSTAEDTRKILGRMQQDPSRTSELIDTLRERLDEAPSTFTAGSYILAQPAPSGHELRWYTLICHLHDRGDSRATARLETIHVRTNEGTLSLLAWLEARGNDNLEAALVDRLEQIEFRNPPEEERFIDATTVEN